MNPTTPADVRDAPATGGTADAEPTGTEPAGPEPADTGPPPLPALTLRDGLPPITETEPQLAAAVAALSAGSGPVAVDTERASGYRYGQRAYLIQLRRAGAGTFLIDPIALPGLPGLAEALHGPEWILHAASQDLPCLAELDLRPATLFDTELAGRLLGLPRVGLGPMVADLMGASLAKGHGAADWSRRPLPTDWVEYAALDVEILIELRAELTGRLAEAGKLDWARQEFDAVRDAPPPPPRVDPWRRTSGLHKVRSRRGLAIVAALWHARDEIAEQTDIAPGRLLPDSALAAAGVGLPRDTAALLSLAGFVGRGASRHSRAWGAALAQAWAVPDSALPVSSPRGDGPPPARVWAQRDPAAAQRLTDARTSLAVLSERVDVPVENLLTPDLVRRLMWDPADCGVSADRPDTVAAYLTGHGARPWQVELTTLPLTAALAAAD